MIINEQEHKIMMYALASLASNIDNFHETDMEETGIDIKDIEAKILRLLQKVKKFPDAVKIEFPCSE